MFYFNVINNFPDNNNDSFISSYNMWYQKIDSNILYKNKFNDMMARELNKLGGLVQNMTMKCESEIRMTGLLKQS